MVSQSDVLLSLYTGARQLPSAEFGVHALRLLRSTLRFESAILGAGYFSEAGGPPALVPVRSTAHEIDPAGFSHWKAINRADKIIPMVRFAPAKTFNFHAPTVFANRDDLVMRDYAQRFGRQSYLVTALTDVQVPVFEWCSLYRPDPDDQFSESERVACQELMRHLHAAMGINELIHTGSKRPSTPDQAEFAALVSLRGEILAAEPEFINALRRQWNDIDGKRVPEAALRQLKEVRHGIFRGRYVTLRSRPIATFLWLAATLPSNAELLAPRRMDIATLFAAGHSSKEIAQQLGVSTSTVRNQLSVVYRKLGLSSRRALKEALER